MIAADTIHRDLGLMGLDPSLPEVLAAHGTTSLYNTLQGLVEGEYRELINEVQSTPITKTQFQLWLNNRTQKIHKSAIALANQEDLLTPFDQPSEGMSVCYRNAQNAWGEARRQYREIVVEKQDPEQWAEAVGVKLCDLSAVFANIADQHFAEAEPIQAEMKRQIELLPDEFNAEGVGLIIDLLARYLQKCLQGTVYEFAVQVLLIGGLR
jgi:hypothetical protein